MSQVMTKEDTMTTAIKCGACHEVHGSVEEVKECHRVHHPSRLNDDHPSTQVPRGDTIVRRVRDGYFTLVFDTEREDRITLRVQPHWEEERAKRGERVIAYLAGPDNTRNYVGFGFISSRGEVRMWKRFAGNTRLTDSANMLLTFTDEGVAAAGLAFALESGRCCKCGRMLTVPASVHRGMGPVCAAGGWDS